MTEEKKTREQPRTELGLRFYPHLVLRVGQAAPNVATNRRELSQMLEES